MFQFYNVLLIKLDLTALCHWLFFYIPLKHQKPSDFLIFSGVIKRDQWHKMGQRKTSIFKAALISKDQLSKTVRLHHILRAMIMVTVTLFYFIQRNFCNFCNFCRIYPAKQSSSLICKKLSCKRKFTVLKFNYFSIFFSFLQTTDHFTYSLTELKQLKGFTRLMAVNPLFGSKLLAGRIPSLQRFLFFSQRSVQDSLLMFYVLLRQVMETKSIRRVQSCEVFHFEFKAYRVSFQLFIH